jgi:lysophospholipase L1-like esterase
MWSPDRSSRAGGRAAGLSVEGLPSTEGAGRPLGDRPELTLAPILGWLTLVVVAGVFVIDGSVGALTGRLTAPRSEPVAHNALGALAPTADPKAQGDGDGAGLPGDDDGAGHAARAAAPSLAPGGDPQGDEEPPGALALAEAHSGAVTGAAAAAPAKRTPADALFDPCVSGEAEGAACKTRALDGFRAALAKSRKGALGRPLRLSVFGDSVVATDEIPGRLRDKGVAELGDGGPGFVYAHQPHRFCSHEQITRSSSGSWQSFAVSLSSVRDRLYGFGGATAQTDGGSVTTRIKGEPVTRVAVHYLAQPKGGTLELLRDREASPLLTVDSKAEKAVAEVARAEVAEGAHAVALRTSGPVRLFGLVLERDRGFVVDNLGIVSVTAKNFSRNDHGHWAAQIKARQPDLVMVMIGANEAQWLQGGANEMRDYAERYTELLRPIREGGAGCLVISPLDQVEVTDGRILSRKISTRIVEAQRAAAVAVGCGFFDSLAWMGGPGSAARWRRRSWLSGDYIHLTRKGSEQLGDALFAALFAPAGPAGQTAQSAAK